MNTKEQISSISEAINNLDFGETVSFRINVNDKTITKIENLPKPETDKVPTVEK
jgi:hypothetical protein